jgi:signal transduction histidine kinase
MGCVSYDRAGGWLADAELTTLLGTEPGEDVLRALDTLVVPEDRAPTRAAHQEVLASGGETTLQYRLVHAKTGKLRQVIASIRATVDREGKLLSAIATFVDVTDVVDAHTETVKAAAARTLLLRSVSDALAKAPRSDRNVMQSLVDVATAALGDGTVLRVFTADGAAVETDLVSDRDELAHKRVASFLRESARGVVPGIVDASGEAGELWSSIRNVHWREDFQRRLGHPVGQFVQHFISAAVRHDGAVLGYLRVYRAARDRPYQVGDDDLVQVLADRIGYVIAGSRVRQLLEHQRTEHRAVADRLQELTMEQRELLEQLAEVEERERSLLAEAIHDGPMQLVVAVMMRLENSGITQESIDEVELEGLIVTLETSIQRLRTLIVALTPPDLSKGLGEALRKLAEGIFLGTATQITVVGQAHVNLTVLSKCNAHRILREALVNARRHAQAGQVELELIERHGTVIARLTDDGVGATSVDAGPGHLGMATMRARAEADGGRLDVTSAPGKGTTVVLTLPTTPAAHREHHRSDDVPQLAPQDPVDR